LEDERRGRAHGDADDIADICAVDAVRDERVAAVVISQLEQAENEKSEEENGGGGVSHREPRHGWENVAV